MRPTADELRKLYIDDRMTTRQIAKIYGVARISVGRWLRKYGIPVRPPCNGLESRGITPPTKDELIRMIHDEFLTYEQIASKYGADRTAVYHWVTKHGIDRPILGASRTKGRSLSVDHDVVKSMYESGESLTSIGDHFGVSETAIRAISEKAGLDVRAPGFTGERYVCGDGTEVRSTYEVRVSDWLNANGVPFAYEPSYPYGSKWKADFLANGWFIEIWGVRGNDRYDERKSKKIRFCENYGIPLIQLNEWHFSHSRGDLLSSPLSKVLAPAKAQGMLF